MKTLDYISLDKKGIVPVVDELQKFLADLQVFYTNLRGLHWNVTGKQFFQLHEKFEEIYDDINEKADEIAERILMLGGTPVNNYSEYLKTARVKEVSNVTDGVKGVELILETYKHLMDSERSIIKIAGEVEDEVTVALLTDYLKEQEKLTWMLVALLTR